MSRLNRAWRELRRGDPPSDHEDHPFPLYPFPYRLNDVAKSLDEIARTLVTMERRRNRPRIILCRHPELHPEIEMPA